MSALPMPTITARIRRPSSIRKKSLLAVFALLGAGMIIGCIAVLSVLEFKTRSEKTQPTPEIELIKRQFQGGGLMGDTPAESAVSALDLGFSTQPDATPFLDPLRPVESSVGPIGDTAGAVSSFLSPPVVPAATKSQILESPGDDIASQILDGAGATDILSHLSPVATPFGQWSTPGSLVQDGVSMIDSSFNGGATPLVPIPIMPGVPTPIDPAVSITLPPLSPPVGTPTNAGGLVDGLTSQVESLLGDLTSLPVSPESPLPPLGSEQLSVSLPLTPSTLADISSFGSQPTDNTVPSSESVLPGLEEILSEDGNTDVDSAALLSGLSNIVDQISGVDPEAAGELTDAVMGALPDDVSDAIPEAQDAIDAGSPDSLDGIIPSLGSALGEDIIPAPPIDTSNASGALGNVANRGKTIINQIKDAMGDNIDPTLQDVVDNVSRIVESAEEQLTDPMCLVSQDVNGVTDQVLAPCADAEPGAPTAIAHLAPTQNQASAQSQTSVQSDSSSQQPQSGNISPGVPSDDTREDLSQSQGTPSDGISIPEPPTQVDGNGSQASQEPSQSASMQQSSSSGPANQPLPESGNDNTGEQPSPSETVSGAPQGRPSASQAGSGVGIGSQPDPANGSVNTGEHSPVPGAESESPQSASNAAQDVPGTESGTGLGSTSQSSGGIQSPNEPSRPSGDDQKEPGSNPASNGSANQGVGAPSQESSPIQQSTTFPDAASTPGTPATPTMSTNAPGSAATGGASPVDDECPICPQCMPQSCDGNYGFDTDESPCEGRGFECDECLHGWFCPPRETPAQAAPCGLGWPCYHCSDGWFCVPDEDDTLGFVISSNSNERTASGPPENDDSSQNKRQSASARGNNGGGVNNYYSLGCFQDSTSRTLLGGVPVDYLSGRMSTSICVNHCVERGYTFAGTESGHECWCGETMRPDAKKLPESSCQTSCHGNQGSVCGGNMAVSVFADRDEYPESFHL